MIVRAFFLRFVKKHPARFVATLLGVAAGVGSIIAIILSCQAAIRAMAEDVEIIAGKTQIEITAPGGIPQTLLGELRQLAKDAEIVPVVDDLVFIHKLNDMARVLGTDLLIDSSFRNLEWNGSDNIQAEQMMQLLKGEGVLISETLLKQLGITADSNFEVISQAKNHTLEIASTFKPARFSSSWDRLIVMDIAAAQKLFGKNGTIDRIEIIPRNEEELSDVQIFIHELLPPQYQMGTPSDRSEQTVRMIRSLRFNLTALSGISLLVGAVLVAITLYTSVIQRKYMIALLQSLGASRLQIALGVLLEAGCIGLLGGLTGVAFGLLGAWLALSSVRSTIAVVVHGAPASNIEFQPYLLILGVAMGLTVALLSSYWAVREALSTPPLQGLKADTPILTSWKNYRKSILTGVVFMVIAAVSVYLPPYHGLPFPALVSSLFVLLTFVVLSPLVIDLFTRLIHHSIHPISAVTISLAASGIAAAKERAALASSAICLSAALAISMTIMISSFRQTITDWSQQATLSDLWIRPLKTASGIPAGSIDPKLVTLASKLFGYENVDPFYRSQAMMNGENIALAAGAFYPARAEKGGVPFMDGRPSKEVFRSAYQNKAVIVNEPFMRRFGVQKGDTLKLQAQNQMIERKIEAVFYDYSNHQGTVIMDRSDFLQYYPNESPDGIGIFLPEGQSPQDARARFRSQLPPEYKLEIMLSRELRSEIMKVFERTFSITYSLQIISSIVAGIAVLLVLFALTGERKQDLALLQSLGATNWQIILVVIFKAFMMGIIGLTGGLLAGYIVGWILVEVVNLQSFNWTLRFTMPWASLLLMFLLALTACCLAAIAPALTVINQSVQEALRADE